MKQRYSIAEIRNTKWFKKYNNNANKLTTKMQQMISPIATKKRKITSSSQPTKVHKFDADAVDTVDAISQPMKSFSQPAIIEDMVTSGKCTKALNE